LFYGRAAIYIISRYGQKIFLRQVSMGKFGGMMAIAVGSGPQEAKVLHKVAKFMHRCVTMVFWS